MASNYYRSAGSPYNRYNYGSAAPAYDPEEELRERRRQRRQERREAEERQRIQREINKREAAKQNRRHATPISLGYMAYLGVCGLCIGIASYFMISTQMSISAGIAEVASLKSEIADMKAENDARYNEITGSVDLNEIKEYAMDELGMKYVAEDQIKYYSIEKDNYMDQYNDIPQ